MGHQISKYHFCDVFTQVKRNLASTYEPKIVPKMPMSAQICNILADLDHFYSFEHHWL